jgi:hypothetical protein
MQDVREMSPMMCAMLGYSRGYELAMMDDEIKAMTDNTDQWDDTALM